MLEALHSIMTEVNSARDLDATLDILVRSVQKALVTRVCSVYLLDRSIGRYVLMASQGLDPAAVGRVSLSPQEGLVGLVAMRIRVTTTFRKPAKNSTNPSLACR
jgi:phosphotransferase system enzyme I (PtsP)